MSESSNLWRRPGRPGLGAKQPKSDAGNPPSDAELEVLRREWQEPVEDLQAAEQALAEVRTTVVAGRRDCTANRAGYRSVCWSRRGREVRATKYRKFIPEELNRLPIRNAIRQRYQRAETARTRAAKWLLSRLEEVRHARSRSRQALTKRGLPWGDEPGRAK